MKKTTAFIALLGAATLALAGCGTTEPAGADAASGTGAGPAAKITVTDARGKEVVLDGPARRVAGTEWNVLENLVSLGVMPVGASDIKGYTSWVTAAPLDATVKDIGTRGEPSIDTLAALNPDVVLVTDSLIDGAMEQVEKIAPVIVLPGGDSQDNIGQMLRNLDLVAKVTGTEAKAASLKADFQKKLDDGRAAVEAAGAAGSAVAFSDAYVEAGDVAIRPYPAGSLVGDVLVKMGLKDAWNMKGDEVYGLASTDIEGLTQLGDAHFWYIGNESDGGDPYADELADNPIWKKLPFVQDGKTHRFPDGIWMFGGPASMSQLIDAASDAVAANK